jgi:hypothetical protein
LVVLIKVNYNKKFMLMGLLSCIQRGIVGNRYVPHMLPKVTFGE